MKKKVLHVSPGGIPPGGVGSVIFSIVKELYEYFDFGVVVFEKKYDNEKIFEPYCTLHRINCYPLKGKRNYFELITRPAKLYFGIRKICRQEKIDIIHCHNQRDEWVCLLAAKHVGVPTRIAHAHVTNSPRKLSFIEKIYKKTSTVMISQAATLKVGCSTLACEHLFGNSSYVVVPNSVDLSRFSYEGTTPAEYNFIHVGRFNYSKNQEFVIKTFAEICKEIPQAHLYLVGYGTPDETLRLQKLIVDLGVSNQAEIVPGDTVDVASIYRKAKYMIFPSRFEGFGIVLLEAQAMNIACYVSENIQPEANVGLLTFLNLSDGPTKWAEKIVSDIRSGRKHICNRALLAKYSENEICKQYAAIYNSESL